MKTISPWKLVKLASLMAALVALVGCPSPTSGEVGGSGGGGGVSPVPKQVGDQNAAVYATAFDSANNILYIGGDFTEVSTAVPSPLLVNASTTAIQNFPAVTGGQASVMAMAPDGSGGWYIGGNFTHVGGQPRNNLARVNADATVHSWNPNADGQVVAIAVDGTNAVYVAGAFNNVGTQNRPRLAKLNTTNGAADTSFNANASGAIKTIAIDGSDLYVGGGFSNIGGGTNQNLARLDKLTGQASTTWQPNVVGASVNDLVVTTTDVYIGGSFTQVGSTNVTNFAKVAKSNHNTVGATITVSGGAINDLALQGTTLYVGGSFTDFGGSSGPDYAAALDTSTDNVITAWNPNPVFQTTPTQTEVKAIHATATTVYLAGKFTQVGSTTRLNVAAVDTTNGAPTSWTMDFNDQVIYMGASGSNLLLSGAFNGRDPVVRNRLAAINVPTGQVTSFNPNLNGTVYALAIAGGKLYVGGSFTQVGTTPRNRLAAFNLSNGNLDTWNPGATGGTLGVRAIAIKDNTVIVGGDFTTVGTNNASRTGLAAIDSNGAALNWNPVLNSGATVTSLVVDNNTLYVGGSFTQVDSQTRNRLAAFDLPAVTLSSWNPDVNAGTAVHALAVSGGKVYVGGNFTQVGSTNRNNIARVEATGTGALDTTWYPTGGATLPVRALAISGSHLYVGGDFANIGGQSRVRLAKLALSNAAVENWNANIVAPLTGFVGSIAVSGSTIYVGGNLMGAAPWGIQKMRTNILFLNALSADVLY